MDKLRAHYTGITGSSLLTDRYKFRTSSQAHHVSIQEWKVKVRHAGSLCGHGDLSDELCRDVFIFGLNEDNIRTELSKTHIKRNNSEKSLSTKQANKFIAGSSKGIDENVHCTGLKHSQMKLRREPGTCFWCGVRRGPHSWELCPANGKTCTTCGGNDHFAPVCLVDRKISSLSNRPTWRQHGRGPYSSQKREPRTNPRQRNLHYTDMYAKEEEHQSPYDQEHGYMYSLDAQVHSIASAEKSKQDFTNVSLSAAGRTFKRVKFQIHTAATCNTMSASALRSFTPDAEVNRSPYRLHPYGNSKPLHPIGQGEQLCETSNNFDTLIFQVLSDSCIVITPTLLSVRVSGRLGPIRVQANEIKSLCSSADHNVITKHDDLPRLQFTPQVDASTSQNTAPCQSQWNLETFNSSTIPQPARVIPHHHLLLRLLFLQRPAANGEHSSPLCWHVRGPWPAWFTCWL